MLTLGISKPRAATEVAIKIGYSPFLKSRNASSLSRWRRSLKAKMMFKQGPAEHRKEHKEANVFKSTRISTREQVYL